LERALASTLLWMTAGAAVGVPILFLPQPEAPLLTVTVHLILLVGFSIGLTFHLAPLVDDPWFDDLPMGTNGKRALTWVVVVVMVTGATGLVALATSAAFRYEPSLQFLQLLSALDIAWAAAALTLGARRRFGGGAAVGAALALGVVCVWAIWRYLDVVGFTDAGGWLLRAAELNRYVLPYDMGAAAVAVVVFSMGVRRSRASA
jgi:hypothetical protein